MNTQTRLSLDYPKQSVPGGQEIWETDKPRAGLRRALVKSLFEWSSILPVCLALLSGLFAIASAKAAALTPDTDFRAPFFAEAATAGRNLLLPDGEFLLFSRPDTLTDQRTGAITRYLPDGTLDTTFNFSRLYKFVGAAVPAPEGKLYVAATRYIGGKKEAEEILRLHNDGSIDAACNKTVLKSHITGRVQQIRVQPDDKVLVAGFIASPFFFGDSIFRLMPDGAMDSTFAVPQIDGSVLASAIQTDGKILLAGNFTNVNNAAHRGVVRLNSDGSVDSSFQASGFMLTGPIFALAVQNDGKILGAGHFRIGGPARQRAPLFRFNTDGSPDTTFSSANTIPNLSITRDLVLLSDEKIVATVNSSVYRFNTNGSRDDKFRQPVMINTQVNPAGVPGAPTTLNLLPDGRLLVGGTFTDVDPAGSPTGSHFGAARLSSEGVLDPSLTTSHKTGFETAPSSFARLADGSTLVGFGTRIDPAISFNVGRLLPDGSLDPDFTLSSSKPDSFLSGGFSARGFEPLNDASFFVFGTKENGSFTYGKVLPSGAEATGFATDQIPPFQTAIGTPDGKVLLSAGTDLQATVYFTLGRLQADGHGDGMSFQLPGMIHAGQVKRDQFGYISQMFVGSRVLAVQPDGKALFEYFSEGWAFHLVRLNSDGSIDESFAGTTLYSFDLTQNFPVIYDPVTFSTYLPPEVWTASFPVYDAHIQADGRIVLAGGFESYNGTPARNLVRLNPDGSIDDTFNAGGGAQWLETTSSTPSVDNIEPQADGKLLITGSFEAFDGVPAPGIASLNPDGSVDTSFVAPVSRDKHSRLMAGHKRQPDGSFLLSGPYRFPNESDPTSLIRLVGPPITAVNISTRMAVGTGENVLIAGFIITGNVPKKVIIRGIGPSLSSAGAPVAGRLEDTVLALHRGDGSLIVRNDDWRSDQEQEILDSTIPPSDNRESAIVQTLQAGNYTAILSGKDNTTGIGLVEVYDLDSGATSELAQISTRGFVQSGDNVMIGGFIVSGAGGSANVLLRAIGPTLAQAGVNGALQDAVLELFNGSGTSIAVNDDWRSDQEQEIINTTVPPADNRESAILRSLNPGNYTAIVRGKDNTTGVALVEAYVLQ